MSAEDILTTNGVLKMFPGLTRDQLYFWETKGWISPNKVPGKKKSRRQYDADQVKKIAALWAAYGEGFTPKQAHERANMNEVLRYPQLTALLDTSREMVQSALFGNLERTLKTVVDSVSEHLKSEVCSIFLVPEDQPDTLELMVQAGGRTPEDTCRIPIRSEPKGGLTGHIAKSGVLFNDHGAKLRTNEYATGNPPKHLLSHECYSLLAQPIKDRKGRLMGLLKVENKKDTRITPGERVTPVPATTADAVRLKPPGGDVYFNEADETVARILANEVVLTLETVRMTQASRSLLRTLNGNPSREELFDEVLRHVRLLTNAHRGDVIWQDAADKRCRVEATIGKGELPAEGLLPERSIAASVIQDGGTAQIPDVTERKDYYRCDDQTLSEVVVPIKRGSPPFTHGALNVEWKEREGYDTHVVEMLQYFSDFIALGTEVIESKDQEQSAALNDMQLLIGEMKMGASPAEVLRQILKAMLDTYDRARIFVYNEPKGVFECLDSLGVDEPSQFKGMAIEIDKSHYARLTLNTFKTSSLAAVRDPKEQGEDPYAGRLKKPKDMPWAVAPLVVMGKLYGYIAADNSGTQRPILLKDLRRMNRFTTLTAQLIANFLKAT